MQMTRKFTLAGLVALALGAFSTADAQAKPKDIEVLISPSGSGPYLAWATMQNYSADFSKKIRPVAVETPGFTYNVRLMADTPAKWKTTVFGSGEVVEWAARTGIKPFFPKAMKNAEDFKVLGVMSQTTNVFVTLDKQINKPKDFKGKRVAVGLLTQNEWGMHQRMFLDAWKLTKKLKSFDPLGPGQNIAALLDGRADVGTLVVHSALGLKQNLEPGPFKALESSQRHWQYVTVPEKDISSYVKETGAPFTIRKVPAGTFSNQPKDLVSFGNFTLLSAHKTFSEQDAYDLVKLWLRMGPEMGRYSAIAKIWDVRTISELARRSPERIHPGAMRAYKEFGLVK